MKKLIILLLLLFAVQVNGGYVVPGQVAGWACNDANGTGTVVESIAGNNGTHTTVATPSNLVSTTGKIKTALAFDSDSDMWVDAGDLNAAGVPDIMSYAFWVKLDAGAGAGARTFINLDNTNKIIKGFGSTDISVSGGGWSGTEVFYIDGVVATSITLGTMHFVVVTSTVGIAPTAFGIGTSIGSIFGVMDNVMIFDRILTAAEVTLLYNNGRGLETIPFGSPRNRYNLGYRTVFRRRYR